MFTFYWFFKRNEQFMFVFKTGDKIEKATDKEGLLKALKSVGILISFDNYSNFDKELALILSDGKNKYLKKYLSIDLAQEIRKASIEEIGYNTKLLKASENVFDLCMNRIEICEHIFKERETYFETKFDIVSEFKLNAQSIKKTIAGLASEIVKAVKQPNRPDVLIYSYDKNIPIGELPKDLVRFYEGIKAKYLNGFDETLKKQQFKMTLNGLTHTFGLGGVHSAKEKYKADGHFLHIDAKAFYTSLIINNNWISNGIKNKENYLNLYDKKAQYELEENPKALIYKEVINVIFGSTKNPYSDLYDPNKFHNVTVNGQLIMAHLILILENFIEELIQTNTDGIVVRYNPEFYDLLLEIVGLWGTHYNIDVAITKINKIHQRDVNNYIFWKENGQTIRKGIYKEPNYLNGSMPIINETLFANAATGIKPQDYIIEQFKMDDLSKFYFIGKKEKDQEKVVQKLAGFADYKTLTDTVCGVATNKKKNGGLFQVKKGLYSKLRNSPENFMNYLEANKKQIDLNWYVDLVEKNIF